MYDRLHSGRRWGPGDDASVSRLETRHRTQLGRSRNRRNDGLTSDTWLHTTPRLAPAPCTMCWEVRLFASVRHHSCAESLDINDVPSGPRHRPSVNHHSFALLEKCTYPPTGA